MEQNPILTRNNFWAIALNSTAAYLLASMIIFYVNHLMTIIGAALFGYDLSFDYNIIYYHIESYEWTADSVKLIFSAGPIMLLIIGIVSMIFFSKISEDQARIKILLIWIALIAFNYFFGGLLIGNLFKKGIGHVFTWMYLQDTEKMAIALFGLFSLVSVALLMAKPVALSTNSYINNLNENNFPFIITAQIIVPFILGTALTLLYHLPRILFQERYSWISLALILAIIIGRINNFNTTYFDEEPRQIRIAWLPVLLTLVIIGLLRFVLNRQYLINL
jgi:hypothetical protein